MQSGCLCLYGPHSDRPIGTAWVGLDSRASCGTACSAPIDRHVPRIANCAVALTGAIAATMSLVRTSSAGTWATPTPPLGGLPAKLRASCQTQPR